MHSETPYIGQPKKFSPFRQISKEKRAPVEEDRKATGHIQQMRNDLKRAEALREELRRDIALGEGRITELGGQTLGRSEGRETAQA